jgi:3-deoxy-manno-octulosonate cytidylyltransferase (CMP-KDO synthetase)
LKKAVIIPARYASSRLPGKPLCILKGKPLIQYAYEIAKNTSAHIVLVATDDQRILEAVRAFGGEAVLTSPEHPSGSDRVAEAVKDMEVDVVVNLQCDEPFLDPQLIDKLFEAFKNQKVEIATLIGPLSPEEWVDPNVVKVVRDKEGFALYFSRAPIPYPRDGGGIKEGLYWRHIGVYAYRKETLLKITSLPPSPLELEEKLEQLRFLENGFKIFTIPSHYRSPSVDTEDDLRKVMKLLG